MLSRYKPVFDPGYKRQWKKLILSLDELRDRPRDFNFITLDAPDCKSIARDTAFGKGVSLWRKINNEIFGLRWRDEKKGLFTLFCLEREKSLWHIHMVQDKHERLTYDVYRNLWYQLWIKDGRHTYGFPRKAVDLRSVWEVGEVFARYLTEQTTERNYLFITGPNLVKKNG
jgi:hypothetical protein